nr:EAL domain-containing protein [Hyphomonas sp. Mor2]
MGEAASNAQDSGTEVDDRHRQYGYTACFAGIPITLFSIAIIHALGQHSIYVWICGLIGIATLSIVGVCCYLNFAVKRVLSLGLLVTYANVWGLGTWETLAGDFKQHQLALMLFIPLIIVSLMKNRMIFMLIPAQFGLVFFASTQYAHRYFSDEFTDQNIIILGILFAAMSCVVFFMSAITARIRDRNDQKFLRVIEENRLLSLTDHLTGLINRRALTGEIETTWNDGTVFTLAFMDLDRFKSINDQFGHAAGDALLCGVADRLSSAEEVKFAARIGGDEFAFVLDEALTGEAADRAIERIHTAVTEDLVFEGQALTFGTSIGYAEAVQDVDCASLLLPAAEISMRRAKLTKAGWARYDVREDDATMATAALEVAFKRALNVGRIRAALQPIGCAQSHDIKGFELLSRWVDSGLPNDPRPDQFIPIAEKLGLLNQLLWVTLNEALANADLRSKFLSINVSPAQIVATDFVWKLRKCLKDHGFPAQNLVLEITEEVAFRNVDRNVMVLKEARRHGMTVALDDFGKGYSSLSIVEKLPLDKLKIDRSLVLESDHNQRMESILDIALQMADKLGLESCVEGVEREGVAQRVAELGATEIQGYWLGKPELVSTTRDLENVA